MKCYVKLFVSIRVPTCFELEHHSRLEFIGYFYEVMDQMNPQLSNTGLIIFNYGRKKINFKPHIRFLLHFKFMNIFYS